MKIPFPHLCNIYSDDIGDSFIGPFCEIQKGVKIGNNCRIQSHTFICEGVEIEDDCFIGHGVMFVNDLYPPQPKEKWGKTLVKKGSVIGSNATILPCVIGKRSLIGAGSVVVQDVSPDMIVVGNPARELRKKKNQNLSHWKGKSFNKCHRENISNGLSEAYKEKRKINTLPIIPWNKGKKGLMKFNKGSFKKGMIPWNYRGIETEEDNIRKRIDCKNWRISVFERDNYTCQKYGVRGGELNAHHINNFIEYPELRFAIDNGITLSKKAHKEFHKKYGYKKNNKNQLIEFLRR